MIERIATEIPGCLKNESGKVFCSGRKAFTGSGGLYVLGFNPGGDPDNLENETIAAHTRFVLSDAPDEWSAYVDEVWQGNGPNFQHRMQHLFRCLNLDPRRVASSNLIFTRSKRIGDLGLVKDKLIAVCWPVHAAVLNLLRPRAVICLGREAAESLCDRVGANQRLDAFSEMNNRKWESKAWRSDNGLIVFQLTHPSIADWTTRETDPCDMVRRVLRSS